MSDAIKKETNEEDLIYGRNSVTERLRRCERADTLYLCKEEGDRALAYIAALAREKGAVVKEVHPARMAKLCGSERHQGVALLCPLCDYCSVESIFDEARRRGEAPLFVVVDGIEDPHNLGAIIRSAACLGAHGVLIPKRRSCTITPTVHRASAGAVSAVRIARVGNLAAELRELKKRGVFCYCADMDGAPCAQIDLTGAAALVVGSEGFGVSRLVRELCDFTVRIPMTGTINSLNASVAAGILLYEFARQRSEKEKTS